MTSTIFSFGRRALEQARAVWSSLEYADRRMFEIRTGINTDEFERNRASRQTMAELEALDAADRAAFNARLAPHGR